MAAAAAVPLSSGAVAQEPEVVAQNEVLAQNEGVESIVVRARNVVENVTDVPISITVVQGEELDRLNAYDITQLAQRAANVAWNQGNQRTSSLSIRGIGKQSQTEAQDPSVGIIVDGVSYAYNALASSFDFTDIDTLEVVRGPQGTLLGKNTSAGVINITTRRPTFEPETDFAVTLGERDTVFGRAALGGPIIDNVLAWRGTFNVQKGQGWLHDAYDEDFTYQNKERVTGRVQLLWTPTSNFDARLVVDATPRSAEATNGVSINTPRPRFFSDDPLTPADESTIVNTGLQATDRLARQYFAESGFDIDRDYYYGGETGFYAGFASQRRGLVTGSNGVTLNLDWKDVGPFDITSITAYKDYHFHARNDDSTQFDIDRNSGGYWNDYRQISQELRVNSQIGDLVDYQAGLYYIKVNNEAEFRREWGADAGAWYASAAQYNRLAVAVNPDGSVSGGALLLRNSLEGVRSQVSGLPGIQDIENESVAAFGQANWHAGSRLTLTTGIRVTQEDRSNITSKTLKDSGTAPELNPAVVNNVVLGGFDSNATTGVLNAGNSAEQLTLADKVATRYFGVAATGTPGAAYNSLTAAQKRQVADAKAIRQAQLGVVYNEVYADPFKDTQYSAVISPSYAITDDINVYVSWQYGEKAGISQTFNGVSDLIGGEINSAYEAGVKGVLFDDLTFSVDYFWQTIDNYQQSVRVVDEYTTALNRAAGDDEFVYATITGSVPKVKAEGLEIDATYSGIPNTTIRASVAYNDAWYVYFPNAAQPAEYGFPGNAPYRDISGSTLPGVPEWSGAVGFEYRQPVFGDKEFHLSGNVAFESENLTDTSLSAYSLIPAHATTDLGIGFGREDGLFDVTLLAKNAFQDQVPRSNSWTGYTPREPRWIGLVFSGSF